MVVMSGDVVGGRYSIGELVARGGMADVYRAHDARLERWVAVKAFRSDPASEVEARRFEREMRLLAGLNHPYLVRLLDAGHHADSPYLVLELVQGPTLADQLGNGPLDPPQAGQVGRDLARALAYVHDRGVVHRDVKPSNVLLTPDGRALLGDFGIAQLPGGTRLTATSKAVGTVAYLAPEQVEGTPVTGAADVYALGLLLVEALSGRKPFEGTQHEMIAARMVADPVIPDEVPPALTALVRAMTRRDPTARPEAADVAVELASQPSVAGAGEDVSDDALAAVRASPARRLVAVAPPGATVRERGRRLADRLRGPRSRGWLAALVPVVAIAAFAVALLVDGDPDPSSPESAAAGDTGGGAASPDPPPIGADDATSTTTSAPATTATSAAPTTTPTPTAAATPVTASHAVPETSCDELEAQKDALAEERERIDEAHEDDRETREALRDQLDERKRALQEQKRALGC